jgi:hypothetical protein
LLLSRVYEQKAAAGDLDAIKILQGISPVAWRNVHLIGNFDFTTASSEVEAGTRVVRIISPLDDPAHVWIRCPREMGQVSQRERCGRGGEFVE